jgi:hypothetical protein
MTTFRRDTKARWVLYRERAWNGGLDDENWVRTQNVGTLVTVPVGLQARNSVPDVCYVDWSLVWVDSNGNPVDMSAATDGGVYHATVLELADLDGVDRVLAGVRLENLEADHVYQVGGLNTLRFALRLELVSLPTGASPTPTDLEVWTREI